MTPEQVQGWANEACIGLLVHHDGTQVTPQELETFAKLVANYKLEEAAITAWSHYMDTCKSRKLPPASFEHFISSSKIRSLKT
jgi:hypothetical protein